MRVIKLFILHYIGAFPTGYRRSDFYGEKGFSIFRKWHKDKGWFDIGYHYGVDMRGKQVNGRMDIYQGAHCYRKNKYSIGINCMFFEGEEPSEEMLKTLVGLLQELNLLFHNLVLLHLYGTNG